MRKIIVYFDLMDMNKRFEEINKVFIYKKKEKKKELYQVILTHNYNIVDYSLCKILWI